MMHSVKVDAEFFEYVVVKCTPPGMGKYKLAGAYKPHDCSVAEAEVPGGFVSTVDALPRRVVMVM